MANSQSRFRVHKGRVIGPDMANVYSNAVQTVATQGHVNLDNFPSVTSGSSADTHGHVLQVLDIKNDSGADGRVYIGGQFVATTTNPATGAADEDYLWGAGSWDDDDGAGASVYAQLTDEAKSATADDFPIAGAAADDGFIVHSTRQFSCIVVAIGATQQNNHANTVQTYTYWNGAAWAALPLLNTAPLYSVANTDYSVIFGKPLDWALTTSGVAALGGIPAGRYAIRYQATNTAPTQVGLASRVFVGDVLRYPASLVPSGGALVANDIGWPISSQDEAPWAVLGVSAAAWEIAVGTERTPFAGTLGA